MTLLLCREPPSNQTEDADSFQGGQPKLPDNIDLPTCANCQARLTFFFQIAFPVLHSWQGYSMAVFACTSCADEHTLIPEMLQGQLAHAEVTSDFLRQYATNFRTLVFETSAARIRDKYSVAVQFSVLSPCRHRSAAFAQVGGSPSWVLEDETPSKVAGSTAIFLFQLLQGLDFRTLGGAPPQMDLALDGSPQLGAPGRYQLFLGNEIYFFGPTEPSSLVYVLTQVD
jgi:hypothetical protein